jgi:hypothetical protein
MLEGMPLPRRGVYAARRKPFWTDPDMAPVNKKKKKKKKNAAAVAAER